MDKRVDFQLKNGILNESPAKIRINVASLKPTHEIRFPKETEKVAIKARKLRQKILK